MSDPQRTIPRAPQTPRSRGAAAALLVLTGGVVSVWAGSAAGGIAAAAFGLVGLGLAMDASRRAVRRFEEESRARSGAMAAEIEDHRRAETRLRAELRAAQAAFTESEDLRRRAESSDRAKTAFLSNLSCELRTPLNNVLGMAGILLDTKLTESQADYARTIHGAAEALITVVDEILDLSRLDDGDLQLDQREFEFGYCIEGVVERCATRAKVREILVEIELDPSIPSWVSGDRRRLRQVLVALLNRAVERTTAPRLRLRVWTQESSESESIVKFEIGQRSGEASRAQDEVPGSAASVSMSLAFRLVQCMGGSLDLRPDGVSSAFSIRLGRIAHGSMPTCDRGADDLAGLRMMLVSASSDCERAATGAARSLGMEIDVATTGTDALRRLKQLASAGTAHVVVAIDAELSDISGCEFVGILRASPELRGIGSILLQPPGAGSRPEDLSRQGFDAWLKKPLSETRLRTALLHVTADPGVPLDKARRTKQVAGAESALPSLGADVLLAEDNLVNQKVTTLMLERLGCRVAIAATGMQAIEQVMDRDFDVILMDCLMPELNGYDATRAIRRLSDQAKRQTPIVALTAGADESDRRACLDAGMNAHLSKPVRISMLASVLQHWTGTPVMSPKETTMSETSPIDAEVLASLKELGGDDPSIFAELVELFLSDTPERLHSLERAQESGDAAAIAESAHALKSSCGNLGAMALFEMLRDIESFGRSGDVESVASLLPRVRSEFDRVEDVLRRESGSQGA